MELRSSRKKQDYQDLQKSLESMGAYEEGMELQEMRQVLDALEMSATGHDTSFLESDIQQALRESEMDFMPSQRSQMMNSTMMGSQPSSPEPLPQTIVVHAVVHHPMDWSPTSEHLLRKRLASSSDSDDNISESREDQNTSGLLEPDAKRFHEIRGPVSMRRVIDSGVNMSNEDEMPSSSRNTSREDQNTSGLSEPNTNRFHEVRGPVSVRRVIDSGVNMSNEDEMPSSSRNTSREDQNTSGLLEPNTNRFHEIRGPVSVRRVIDSGVNMSNEDEMPSSSRNTSNETSNNLLSNEDGNNVANRSQFSTRSAAISGEHEFDEHWESSV